MTTTSAPLSHYALGVALFLLAFLLLVVVIGPFFGRALDRMLDRRWQQARQELADPVLAARRGHTTRLTRNTDYGWLFEDREDVLRSAMRAEARREAVLALDRTHPTDCHCMRAECDNRPSRDEL